LRPAGGRAFEYKRLREGRDGDRVRRHVHGKAAETVIAGTGKSTNVRM
jgi:hypothetical protein